MTRFRNLTEQQENVFEQIAVNNDSGHSFLTVDQLIEKGLVEKYVEGKGFFSIYRYRVPLLVHIEWCSWCAEQPDDVLFDYEQLDVDTRAVVQQRTGEIKALVKRSAQDS